MTDYTIINGTGTTLSNVNAGGTDVSPYSYRDGVTMTDTEIGTLLGTEGVAVIKNGTGVAHAAQVKRAIAMASKFANVAA